MGHLLESLLEQVTSALQLGAFVAVHELREVSLPDVLDVRPLE